MSQEQRTPGLVPDPADRPEGKEQIRPGSKVGLSLSACVSDILSGEVEEEEVRQIISSTKAESPEDWDKIIRLYRETYWMDSPDKGEEICRRLIADGKIRQPRVERRNPHNIAEGHWLDAEKLDEWKKGQGWKD